MEVMDNPDDDKGRKGRLDLSALDGLDFNKLNFDGLGEQSRPLTTTEEINRLLQHIKQLEELEKYSGFNRMFVPGTPFGIDKLPKHYAFFKATKDYHEVYLSAANRFGKTVCGSAASAYHLTGLYPSWWPGRRFNKPTSGWACGQTSLTTRDILQKELLGEPGNFGTGMIPPELILKTTAKAGVPNAVDTVVVKHVSGGASTLSFKSYDQGIKAYFGTAKDFIWDDELPPLDIYNEQYIRTMTTNGIMLVTATPIEGMTPLVVDFYVNADFLPEGNELPGIVKLAREDEEMRLMDEAKKEGLSETEIELKKNKKRNKAVIIGGWNDAPWLTEESKIRMMEATPPHLREARSQGLPSMGSGSIYPIPLEEVLVQNFEIPPHFKRIYGFDVGWNNTAAILLAQDPDDGTVYVTSEYKRGQSEPVVHADAIKRWGDWIPGEIDPASRGRSQTDGMQLFAQYRQHGLKLHIANNAVEGGIYSVHELLAAGKLKFFKSCLELQKEYITYRRDDKGRIIKDNDHLLDALRYAIMGLHHAKQKPINSGRGPRVQGGGLSGRKYDI